jgi:hypothetical protein
MNPLEVGITGPGSMSIFKAQPIPGSGMPSLRPLLVALALAVALMVPATAGAQTDPIEAQYQPTGQQITGEIGGDGDTGKGDGGQAEDDVGQGVAAGGGGQSQGGGTQGQVGVDEGQVGVDEGQVGVDEGQVGVDEGQVGVDEGQGAGAPEQVSFEQGQVSGEQGGGLDERVVSGAPFTGFDLLAMALALAAITGAGFALRRLSRPPTG